MGDTSIEWANKSWNPIRARNKETGGVGHFCEKVSPGCAHCYSATMQKRFRNKIRFNAADRDKVDLFLDEKVLAEPLRWRTPRKVFVCSMTDLFADFVPDEWIDRIFAVMALAPQHTFQLLTKRPERMREYITADRRCVRVLMACVGVATIERIAASGNSPWPLPNVWLGTSVENQPEADERLPSLIQTPAAVRFVSAEPLLGPIDFEPWLTDPNPQAFVSLSRYYGPDGFDPTGSQVAKTRVVNPKFDWLIVGGESGPSARPFDIAWARFIVRQCEAAGIPCFVKQLGARPYDNWPAKLSPLKVKDKGKKLYPFLNLKDSKGGDLSEFPADLRVRDFPAPTLKAAARGEAAT